MWLAAVFCHIGFKGTTGTSQASERMSGQGGDRVIRQAISCDICGTEKRQTNHWFVAYDQGGELRVSEWNSRNRLRPESKHLCGQTCLHKLVDEFMARAMQARTPQAAIEADEAPFETRHETRTESRIEFRRPAAVSDMSLTSRPAFKKIETPKRQTPAKTSAIPVQPAAAAVVAQPARPPQRPMELVVAPALPQIQAPPHLPAQPHMEEAVAAADEPPRYASRNWHAAAWERERERESRAGERHSGLGIRRRFS
jgi:hypothetical protein